MTPLDVAPRLGLQFAIEWQCCAHSAIGKPTHSMALRGTPYQLTAHAVVANDKAT